MDEYSQLLQALLEAREQRLSCTLVTVIQTTGSIPREPGAKMLVYSKTRTLGTVGGGKFEALVIDDALQAHDTQGPQLKTYPLHEGDAQSFGAICGGTVTVLIEPQILREALIIVGAGHCSRAVATFARECGLHITVIDDRQELLEGFPAHRIVSHQTPAEFIGQHPWKPDEALILLSRNFHIDRDALAAALSTSGMGYIGMIGSLKKVRHVLAELSEKGFTPQHFERVHAPIGLDIGADAPAEIAISILSEVLRELRKRNGKSLRHRLP